MPQVIVTETPIKMDIELKHGKDFNQTIQVLENDMKTPKNTTGYTMTWRIKRSANGETYATWTIGSGITHTAASGNFSIRILAATLDGYSWASAVYDVQIVDAGGNSDIVQAGSMIFM